MKKTLIPITFEIRRKLKVKKGDWDLISYNQVIEKLLKESDSSSRLKELDNPKASFRNVRSGKDE